MHVSPAPTTEFADWYRANHPGVVEAVVRAVRPPALAADAVDEAFARAFAAWDRVQVMRSPTGWVYRVAVNEARRQVRRATREEAVLIAAGPGAHAAPPPEVEAWLLVHELPARQRATVVLRHVAGLTEAEVGAALGVTRSTVSSSLAAAYRTLANKLTADDSRSVPAMPDPPSTTPSEPPLRLGIASACGPTGCEVDDLGFTTNATVAAYGHAVRDAIKVRPGDLVAMAIKAAGPEIVWRWWSGLVETVAGGSPTITVSRNVTQRAPDDPRRAAKEVEVPDELSGRIDVGETVWFGEDDDRLVVVAVAGREARAAAEFARIQAAYSGDQR